MNGLCIKYDLIYIGCLRASIATILEERKKNVKKKNKNINPRIINFPLNIVLRLLVVSFSVSNCKLDEFIHFPLKAQQPKTETHRE